MEALLTGHLLPLHKLTMARLVNGGPQSHAEQTRTFLAIFSLQNILENFFKSVSRVGERRIPVCRRRSKLAANSGYA